VARGVLRRGRAGARWRRAAHASAIPCAARFDAEGPGERDGARQRRAPAARPSYFYNTVAQTIYTFATAGSRSGCRPTSCGSRHPSTRRDAKFGGVLLLAGFVGTLIGGRGGDACAAARRRPLSAVSGGP
jgi:hypothetical protein